MLLKSALKVFVARPRNHSLKSPRMIFGPVTRWSWTKAARRGAWYRRSSTAVPVDVVDVDQPAVAQIEIGALAGAASHVRQDNRIAHGDAPESGS